jgi:hypothetical protein
MQEAEFGLTAAAMQPAGAQGNHPDDILLVRFTIEAQQNKTKTAEEGRPIFEDTEWISIMAPGSRNEVRREARLGDKERFPRHYAAFKNRQDQQVIEGTPLNEWTGATRSQVEEMRFWNILTVEQLAGTADSAMGSFRGLVTLKQSALKYLEASKGNAMAEKFAALEAKYEALLARMGDAVPPAPKKRKRRSSAEMKLVRAAEAAEKAEQE